MTIVKIVPGETKFVNLSGIIPLADKVLVKVPEVEEKSAGGVIIPEKARKREEQAGTEAVVIALGDSSYLEYTGEKPVKPGDTVCIARFAGQLYTGNDGAEYRIINEDDIAGVKI